MSGRVIGAVESIGDVFIPCTREVPIGRGVVYRPLRSWHSGVLAGEGITSVHGDGSGCLKRDAAASEHYVAPRPQTVTHRVYWNVKDPTNRVSAFLSYPNAMGCCDEYFWEANLDDCQRWVGPRAEEEMEAAMLSCLGDTTPEQDATAFERSG
jgi:hypothetical protein